MSGFAAAALLLFTTIRPAAAETLEIGYMPILPVSQVFVALEEGWLADAGIEPKLIQFQNGPAMVQALLAGQLDVAHFGIGPAMVARAKGVDLKVVASSTVEQISIVALPDLAAAFDAGPPETAFARFAETHGRKPVIATFPLGSVPETVLHYWVERQLGISRDTMTVVYQGAAQVQQALLTGAVDGAAILEPVVALTLDRVDGAKVVAKGSELFPGQPGAVLAVREALIARAPQLVQALVAAQIRATETLRNDPEGAAAAVGKYVGGGRMPKPVVVQALQNSQQAFVDDPDYIIPGTRTMHDYQAEVGTLKAKVDLDALFDTRFYKAAKAAAN
ncbi:MAG: ABC transporter substrate-binding protein [Alphaproteobacteria bacterium]|nr:ABC transporter substrate-binding protein [Alphaproteobacteria bacterium]MCB9928940.1 ABC transporter substrate-binding protein [Alphaproteobacteria bacterium]